MKKYVLWPLLAAIGGVGAFLLRLLQRSTGFEVDTGLPIPGNLYAILLVAWFVVLAAVCLLAARPLLPADREDPPLFPAGFSVASPGLLTPAVMGSSCWQPPAFWTCSSASPAPAPSPAAERR